MQSSCLALNDMNAPYYLRTSKGESGPFSEGQVAFKLTTKQIGESDMYWQEGNGEWLPLSVIAADLKLAPDAPSVAKERPKALSKDRGVYLVLGVLLGYTGVHNLYAERMTPGVCQLLLGLVSTALLFAGSPFAFVTATLLFVWVIVDLVSFKA